MAANGLIDSGAFLALLDRDDRWHQRCAEAFATVFTVDHDDFETYRIDGRRRFSVVPDRRTSSIPPAPMSTTMS
jgi:hypothetical protein